MASVSEPASWPSMRTASTEHLHVRSPVPGSTSPPDGINYNVERLEQSAEVLSQGGSDIGEEIRKLREEQRRSLSRHSSFASRTSSTRAAATANTTANIHNPPPQPHPISTFSSIVVPRSRGASTSSYTNSIVDLHREARWGGYSPGAFIGSPAASVHSASWSQSLYRTTSNAMSITSSRPEPVQEGRPLDSPLASSAAFNRQASYASLTGNGSIQHSTQSSRRGSRASQHSFADLADRPPQYTDIEEERVDDHGSIPHPTQSSWRDSQVPQDVFVDQAPAHIPHPETQFTQETDPIDNTLLDDHELGDRLADDGEEAEAHPLPDIPRPASTDTYRQANILFQDFDGVHFSPENEEFIATDEQGNVIGRIPLDEANEAIRQRELQQSRMSRASLMPPPQLDNMVFYPAPVPRILNLPQKLSSRPASTLMAQRRSHILFYPPRSESRNTVLLSPVAREEDDSPDGNLDADYDEDAAAIAPLRSESPHKRPGVQQRASMATLNRMSVQQRASMVSLNRMSHIPPQLRASMFFDQPAEAQNINIQNESASATLESILQASANAPVSVFTDHPIVGRAGANVYAKERPAAKRSNSKPLVADARNSERPVSQFTRRRSASGLMENSSEVDGDTKLPRRNSVISMLTDFGNSDGKKLQKRNSRHSLGSQDMLGDETDLRAESPAPSGVLKEAPEYHDYDHEGQDDDGADYEEYAEDPDMGPVYTQPTTLLAELQLRKAQHKSRNRTAATAFPNGMHATLLEMDAVAQIESRKRKNHKVTLAWEDPAIHETQQDDEDDDVPLAALYPTKNGTARRHPGESDWDRPLGLMERRQLEDNEPLSSRRNRLLGIDPRAASRMHLSAEPSPTGSISPRRSGPSSYIGEEHDPDEDIPLAERKRKMQQKAALDGALKEVSRDSKSTFEADVLNTLGVTSADEENKGAEKENVEETLGQRRARLQREKSGLTQGAMEENGERPALRQSMSLANLLGSAPLDPHSERVNRRNITSPTPTSLLGRAESQQAAHKAQMLEHNSRKSSYQDRSSRMSLQPQDFSMQTDQRPGQMNANGQINGLIGSAGGGVTGLNRRTSSYSINPQASGSMPALQSLTLQSKVQAGLAQHGQMMNPLAFTNFVPPAPVTGLGFNGGMSAAPMGYAPMMPGYGMQQAASMPYGFGAQNTMMSYGNGMIGMSPGMMSMGYGYNPSMAMHGGNAAAGGGYGMMGPGGMNTAQQDTIDRWRSSVAQ